MSKRMFDVLCLVIALLCADCAISSKSKYADIPLGEIGDDEVIPVLRKSVYQQAYKCGKTEVKKRKDVQDGKDEVSMSQACAAIATQLVGWIVSESKSSRLEFLTDDEITQIYGRCGSAMRMGKALDPWCYKKVLLVSWVCGNNDHYEEDLVPSRSVVCNQFAIDLGLD